MGAWGIGIFENDQSNEWLNDFNEIQKISFIEDTIDYILNNKDSYLQVDECNHALAATEVLACINGKCSQDSEDVIIYVDD